jgi:hypothetical protein
MKNKKWILALTIAIGTSVLLSAGSAMARPMQMMCVDNGSAGHRVIYDWGDGTESQYFFDGPCSTVHDIGNWEDTF